jgi:hypothetical protein
MIGKGFEINMKKISENPVFSLFLFPRKIFSRIVGETKTVKGNGSIIFVVSEHVAKVCVCCFMVCRSNPH